MKAMILAAGRGERMMPLTVNTPKPMLYVGDKPLLQYHIEKLARAGIHDIVINHAWCGDKIIEYFANGEKFNVNITYSDESSEALETAGGIKKALPLLANNDDDVFLVVNGDVYCDFDYQQFPELATNCSAHLWLIENPKHNVKGDFCLVNNLVTNINTDVGTGMSSRIKNSKSQTFTFSGIALYRSSFFSNIAEHKKLALGPLLRSKADKRLIVGHVLSGQWTDVGTPERLNLLNQLIE
jgi:MurNAc alpha-1-phosphate uridylyltransferase